jgi:hypothetical protein
MNRALIRLQNQSQSSTLPFLFHPSFSQRREKFKWSQKKPSLGLGLNLESGPNLVFFFFFLLHRNFFFWHQEKLGWNKKKPSLSLTPNSKSGPSSTFFLFASSELLSMLKEALMDQKKSQARA